MTTLKIAFRFQRYEAITTDMAISSGIVCGA